MLAASLEMTTVSAANFRLSADTFLQHLTRLSDAYYNTAEPLVTDDEFDRLVEEYENTYKCQYKYLGSAPKHHKAKLPVCMPSLNKCKDAAALTRFSQGEPTNFITFVYSEKLDGVSLLAQFTSSGTKVKLYTRGDGAVGTDVSHLAAYLNLPRPSVDLLVRGELVLPSTEPGENLRNIVCGLVNGKTPQVDMIKKLHFVAYGLPKLALRPSEAFEYLGSLGFELPCRTMFGECNLEVCNNTYDVFLGSTKYNIDGVVVAKDVPVLDPTQDNPKHMMAFKRTNAVRTTVVRKVNWQVSRYGTSHPQVEIDPVDIDGCKIQYVSGNNARYIFEQGIGPGCRLDIQRSGEVIPNIVRILHRVEPQMPSEYEWDGVHIRLPAAEREKDIARLTHSMKVLGAKGVSKATIEQMYDAGLTTEAQMWSTSAYDLSKLDGFQAKKAQNIVEALAEAYKNLNLLNLLQISACFDSFGERKLQAICEKMDLSVYLKHKTRYLDAEVINILGSLSIRARAADFVESCNVFRANPYFMSLLEGLPAAQPTQQQQQDVEIRFRAVFTGFRPNDELVQWCAARGIKTSDSAVTRNTDCVVASDTSSGSSKVQTALKLKIPVYNLDEFKQRYAS